MSVFICLYLFYLFKNDNKRKFADVYYGIVPVSKDWSSSELKKTMKMFFLFFFKKKEVKAKKKARHTFHKFFSGTSKSSEQLTFFT